MDLLETLRRRLPQQTKASNTTTGSNSSSHENNHHPPDPPTADDDDGTNHDHHDNNNNNDDDEMLPPAAVTTTATTTITTKLPLVLQPSVPPHCLRRPNQQPIELGTIQYCNITNDGQHGDYNTVLQVASQNIDKPIFANFVEWSG